MTIRPFPKRTTGLATVSGGPGLDSLFSDGSADFISPAAPYQIGQCVTIRMRGLKGIDLSTVFLRIFPDGEERLIKMSPEENPPFTYWKAEVTINRTPFFYRFRIQTSRQVYWLNASGLHPIIPPDEEDFRIITGFQSPSWPRRSVFYQIFPDRFNCGRPESALAPRPLSPSFAKARIKKWDEPLSFPNQGNDFYGGDLWGIMEKLDYLQDLGVNALYLTPIFESPSNHKYDTMDFRKVDPYFGGDQALVELSKALAKRRMGFVLDGVFNHAGYHHLWFQEALKDPRSPCCEMFTFIRHPKEYVSWLGHSNLPKLNFASPKVREEIYLGGNSVAKHWLRAPFSAWGWRLDVPNMLGKNGTDEDNLEIWREFRREVKKENPEAFIFGECFFEGTKWLQGDAFDAVMNYKGFTMPMIQWLSGTDVHLNPAETTGRQTAQWMTAMMARIPFEIRNLQYNSLSTHDIPRFLHRVKGNDRLYKLALTIQMAFPGVPAIYYGEELSMLGGKDPDNRRPMAWEELGGPRDLRSYMTRLIRMKRSMPVLENGAFAFLVTEEDTMAFARFVGEDVLIVAVNRAPAPRRMRIPVSILGLANGQNVRSLISMDSLKTVKDGVISLSLSPREGLWLVPA